METSIVIVQFLSLDRTQFWEPSILRNYFVGDDHVRINFEEEYELDDGTTDFELVRRYCLEVFETYEDYINRGNACYVAKEDSDFILSTIHVITDEDHKILRLA